MQRKHTYSQTRVAVSEIGAAQLTLSAVSQCVYVRISIFKTILCPGKLGNGAGRAALDALLAGGVQSGLCLLPFSHSISHRPRDCRFFPQTSPILATTSPSSRGIPLAQVTRAKICEVGHSPPGSYRWPQDDPLSNRGRWHLSERLKQEGHSHPM